MVITSDASFHLLTQMVLTSYWPIQFCLGLADD